jgi:hypothetical protein
MRKMQLETSVKKKNVSRIHNKTFYSKFVVGFLSGSKLIKTKIIIKRMSRGYPTTFADSKPNPKKNYRNTQINQSTNR